MSAAGPISRPSLVMAMDLVARFESAPTSAATGAAFFDILRPWGLRALYARSYPSRATSVSTETLAKQQHVYARISPPGWEETYAQVGLDRSNPLIRGIQTRADSFIWSEIVSSAELAKWPGWNTLPAFNVENGIGVPCHGPGGYCAAVSMGFEHIELSPRERRAIDLACVALHDQMKSLSPAPPEIYPVLSERERDALAFVAEGKSDWEIGVILNIAQATAHSHVENAKRKLDAKTRAQAVARAARLGLI